MLVAAPVSPFFMDCFPFSDFFPDPLSTLVFGLIPAELLESNTELLESDPTLLLLELPLASELLLDTLSEIP